MWARVIGKTILICLVYFVILFTPFRFPSFSAVFKGAWQLKRLLLKHMSIIFCLQLALLCVFILPMSRKSEKVRGYAQQKSNVHIWFRLRNDWIYSTAATRISTFSDKYLSSCKIQPKIIE